VTSSAPSPEIDLSWQMREREARLLAELMRTSRLTVLYGETGPGRTALLTDGVVPLLRRRESDTVGKTPREARVVIPFPDRRSRQSGRHSARLAELVVFCDTWSGEPLSGLRKCILEATPTRAAAIELSGAGLADMLDALGKRHDLQFLIVLDRFEELVGLDVAINDPFIHEFCEAVNRVGLCANFLLSLSDDAKPRLEGLRRRIQGFDDFSVRLLRWNSVVEHPPVLDNVKLVDAANTSPERAVPRLQDEVQILRKAESKVTLPAADRSRSSDKAARARAKLARAAAGPRVPIETSAVYAFIESTLTETAKSSQFDPWQSPAPPETTETTVPHGPEVIEGEFANFGGASQASAGAPGKEAPLQGAGVSAAPHPAPAHDDAESASASFAGGSFQAALKWLERHILPKP